MPKLLYIEASPRKARSKSVEVAKAFLDTIRNANPSVEVDTLDLWSTELPRFDGSTIDAKYAILHGQPHTAEQAKAWKHVEDVIARFKAPDWYLFSLPMWNFGLPYVLKHYIDVIIQPGLTFSFSPAEGYSGLVTGKKAAAVYARGGAYGSGTGMEGYDMQSKALAGILGFIGLTDLTPIFIEPTLAAPDQVDTTVAKAKEQAVAVAKGWLEQ
jgi:FMN-dependent NADH-azoreductase